jgi:uncharacterized coiled-coil protein SlyX
MSIHTDLSMLINSLLKRIEDLESKQASPQVDTNLVQRHNELKQAYKEQEHELVSANKRIKELEEQIASIKNVVRYLYI